MIPAVQGTTHVTEEIGAGTPKAIFSQTIASEVAFEPSM